MESLVGVVAGTPVDTQMGVEFLLKNNVPSIGYAISKNPKDQSKLQLLSKEVLYNEVVQTVEKAKLDGVKIIFVYCNSLSAAVDMDEVSKETGLSIITPFYAYIDFARSYSSFLVLAANGQSCGKIEGILEDNNNNIKIWSISSLPLVEAIETGKSDIEIFENLKLEIVLKWAQANELEGIILGCTHFPYIEKILKANTDIPILDPAEKMLEKLLETCQCNKL